MGRFSGREVGFMLLSCLVLTVMATNYAIVAAFLPVYANGAADAGRAAVSPHQLRTTAPRPRSVRVSTSYSQCRESLLGP
jgi:hypothetical protein